ncbi:MAG: hypothetical protein HEQ35_24020 [Gloeotrichia echinulata IR180]|jgi:hypothetical protein|nr:hypothetical protein [Gloeotrichia echinulata DEX184]
MWKALYLLLLFAIYIFIALPIGLASLALAVLGIPIDILILLLTAGNAKFGIFKGFKRFGIWWLLRLREATENIDDYSD